MTEAGSVPVWTINSRDAEMHITSQTAGNNVTTTQSFDANTGLIQNQRAGASASVASFDYAFDTIGNLTTRTDNSQPYTERFCYDSLNRLTTYNIGAACTGGTTVAYDFIGNITSKTGTGTYSYGGSRPHAVSGITGTVDGLTNPSYSYDANGNLTCTSSGSGCSGTVWRTVNLTSFNMALSIGQGTNSLGLTYDDQHQRLEQVNTVSGTATTRTVYLNDAASGAMSERVTASGTTPTVWNSFNWNAAPWGGTTANALPSWTDYITIDGQVVAQRKVTYPLASAWGLQNWNGFNWGAPAGSLWGSTAGANPPRFQWGTDPWSGNVVAWNYFNLDHLGSVAVITDQGGNVLQRLSFDAWGKQRNANGTSASCGTITSTTTKGFTNQEQMPTQCLVNLNARLYDTSIGKFMAPDTEIPDAFNGQAFNRYAYVINNPLSLTDPSGHLYAPGSTDAPPGLMEGNYFGSGAETPYSSPSDEQIARAIMGYANAVTSWFNSAYSAAWAAKNSTSSQAFQTMGGGPGGATQAALGASTGTVAGDAANTAQGGQPTESVTSSQYALVGSQGLQLASAGAIPAPGVGVGADWGALGARALGAVRFGVLGLLSALSGDTQRRPPVTLYRAVSAAELADIQKTGQYRPAPGQYEGKLFALSLDQAQFYLKIPSMGASAIVSSSISQENYNLLQRDRMDGYPAVFAPTAVLPAVNADAAYFGGIKQIQ